MFFCLHIYRNILVTVVKESMEQDQEIKTVLHNSLQGQKYLSHLSFLIALKSEINISEELWKIESTVQFKTKIFSFIRPIENSIFQIHDINGIKLLNCLRLHFNQLNEHEFRYNFEATIDHTWSCGLEPETTLHYLLSCNLYSDIRTGLLNDNCALNSIFLMKSF